MLYYSLGHLSDADLLRNLTLLTAQDRATTSRLLAHLAEVDARRLYVPAGYPSMFAYCVDQLHLSEDTAYKRIRAARAARGFPVLFAAIEDGRLHLAAVSLIAPHLTAENVGELVEAATYRRKSDVEGLLARRFSAAGKPTIASGISTIRPIPQLAPGRVANILNEAQLALAPVKNGEDSELSAPRLANDGMNRGQLAPGRVAITVDEDQLVPAQGNSGTVPEEQTPVAQTKVDGHCVGTTPEALFVLRLLITARTRDKLRHAQALLSHTVPTGDMGQVFERALDALIAQTEKQKLNAVRRPQRQTHPQRQAHPQHQTHPPRQTHPEQQRCPSLPKGSREAPPARYIPSLVRRAVWERDGGQCTFVSPEGHRCTGRRFLEFDHIVPVARGGRATLDGLRLRCRPHNQYEAERTFGADFMTRKRREATLGRGRGG